MYQSPQSDLNLQKDERGKFIKVKMLSIFIAILLSGFYGGYKFSQKLGEEVLQKERLYNTHTQANENRFRADIMLSLIENVQKNELDYFYSRACSLLRLSIFHYEVEINNPSNSETRKNELIRGLDKINTFITHRKKNDSCDIENRKT